MTAIARFRAAARRAVAAGDITTDRIPRPGGRWGISAILRPGEPLRSRLHESATAAARFAGAGHWVHHPETLHVTLRAFEPHRRLPDPAADPAVARYRAALAAACRVLPPMAVTASGMTVHRGGLLAFVHGRANGLARLDVTLTTELGRHGVTDWQVEVGFRRNFHHINVIHFTGPVSEMDRLTDWSDRHADLDFGTDVLHTVELVAWRFESGQPAADVLDRFRFTG
ncbi:hypothetical protein LX16_3465 [Stackebrandtia albiflava]|uniref:2'-5' RNA ligase n=1 Tax=Stackebrandtia albiflava TaxID=406432 RepID=A0A562V482_9ACTN|nr:hypothetical protein [Stackebrandtia albiflava]TWJ12701.1 hypothetical protein LX16_3465 [Stackebrandtia albiflava]